MKKLFCCAIFLSSHQFFPHHLLVHFCCASVKNIKDIMSYFLFTDFVVVFVSSLEKTSLELNISVMAMERTGNSNWWFSLRPQVVILFTLEKHNSKFSWNFLTRWTLWGKDGKAKANKLTKSLKKFLEPLNFFWSQNLFQD